MSAKDLVKFWQESAGDDLKVAEDNFKMGHYHWSLYFCQLVLEKILKSLVVKKTGQPPVFTHNLSRLAKNADITLTPDQKKDFDEIFSFNTDARYDDVKYSFYKKATKEFAQKWLNTTKNYYLWLKKR